MARVLNSITLSAPAAPVEASVDDSFTFTGTPGFTGSGGVQRYDMKWEVDSGGGFVTIASTGTGLTTADDNPLVNSNSATANSITVDCAEAGSYTIRVVGAPVSGGSYTVVSSTQTVEVAAAAGTDALLADDLASGAPVLASVAFGQTHILSADDIASGSPTLTSAALAQTHILSADDLATAAPTLSTPAIGEPGGAHDLTANDLAAGTPTLTSATFAQTHILLANDLATDAPELESAVFTHIHVLSADDLAIGSPTLESVAFGQTHVLTADDLATDTPTLTNAVLGVLGTNTLSANDLFTSNVVLGTPSLGGDGVASQVYRTDHLRGRRRYSRDRPQYYWEAARQELQGMRVPTNPKSRKVFENTVQRTAALWRDLDAKDIKFREAMAEVDRLIQQTAFFLESHRIARLLDETKQRIEAAEDAEELPQIQEIVVSEQDEINDLLRYL
jgi:hypothetical protein